MYFVQPSVEQFNALIDQCKQLSAYNTGVDVRYGDTLLALVTCKGDGDCNTCGGSGYKRIGGAKAGCTTCRGNGKCRTCHGSGTR